MSVQCDVDATGRETGTSFFINERMRGYQETPGDKECDLHSGGQAGETDMKVEREHLLQGFLTFSMEY